MANATLIAQDCSCICEQLPYLNSATHLSIHHCCICKGTARDDNLTGKPVRVEGAQIGPNSMAVRGC